MQSAEIHPNALTEGSTDCVPCDSDNLWAAAVAQISDEDRKNIDFLCPDPPKILFDLLGLTETSKRECIDKEWRYTRTSGETVILADLLSKIVKWIGLFRQVGDTVVQYDPKHAGLAWAGVRFLLQIAVDDIDQFAFVFESAASIAEIICRYAIFESLYLQSSSPATDEFRKALIKLYAAIIMYLSKVHGYVKQNSAVRGSNIGVLPNPDTDKYFGAVAVAQNVVDYCYTVIGMQGRHATNTACYIILLIDQEEINQHEDLEKLLQCIDGPLIRVDLRNFEAGLQTHREVLPASGQWLLSDPVFHKWKKESVSSILWLHGRAGSGKTKLVSMVIEDAKAAFQDGYIPTPAFFYCSRNTAEPTRSKANAIMMSIARQMTSGTPEKTLLSPFLAVFNKRIRAEGVFAKPSSIDESVALVIQLTEYYPLTTIVIDALDECEEVERVLLLEAFESILRRSSRLVKIFVSSRNDHGIVCRLQHYPNLQLSTEKNNSDISLENLRTEIVECVTNNAESMFSWASMQLQSLCSPKTDEAIREILRQQLPTLEDLYLEGYEKLTKYSAAADCQVTINVLSWLLCAQQPLKSAEFLAVVSASPRRQFAQLTKEHVLKMCSNMVIFDATLDAFQLAHPSVREFLEKRPEYAPEIINALVAETCILDLLNTADHAATKRLLSDFYRVPSNLSRSDEFCEYSALYWAPHCQLAESQRTVGVLQHLLSHLLFGDSNSNSAIMIWSRRITVILEARTIDFLDWTLRRKLQDTDAQERTPLFVVSCFDFHEFAHRLVDLETSGYNRHSKSILQAAGGHGSCKLIPFLLQNKTYPRGKLVGAVARDTEDGKQLWILLLGTLGAELAIEKDTVEIPEGKLGEDVMKLFLERRGQVVMTEEIVKAAARAFGDLMKLFLELRGAEVVITEGVLKAAAHNPLFGHEILMLLLEQRGSEVVITEGVLKAAASNELSASSIVTLLLERRGAEIPVITEDVIRAAVWNYHGGERVICLLLKQPGVEVVITDELLRLVVSNQGTVVTMLLLRKPGAEAVITEQVVCDAAKIQSKEVMMFLLEKWGAKAAVTEKMVVAAAGNYSESWKDVMMLLLKQRGAEVDITEDVVKATAGNHSNGRDVMMFLLEHRGAEVIITEEVLKAAAGNETNGLEVMTLLLEERREEVVMTPEVIKAAAGNETIGPELLRLLHRQHDIEPLITKEVVRAAAQSGQEKVLNMIRDIFKVSPSDEDWSIAHFYNAAKSGDAEQIRMLLTKGVHPEFHSTLQVSPFSIATKEQHIEVVQILLDTKLVDVNLQDNNGFSPIFWATFLEMQDVAELLLQAGASPSLIDNEGRTPLVIAKTYGYSDIAKLLST
ncbi:hypothetical protein BP5796_12330 [Coleophoma crateriformis]|uniref:Uncharacterized protein n=1 Tax=Coleophoma crateriformis TaxID=565419 RepID=A0A3D8Q9Q4_9HELO|nr:hypothetical protein BP5796_12330 [Coleophoma crateriformis]